MADPSFFWLLDEQREARVAERTEVAQAQAAAPESVRITPACKATALLQALRGTEAGVTALLECPGFAEQEDARQGGGLSEICTEALLAVLLTGASAEAPASSPATLREAAAQAVAVHGAAALTQRLLALGASPKGQANGTPPLEVALSAGHWDVAELLLGAGADPDPPTCTAAELQAPPAPCPPATPETGGPGTKRKHAAAAPVAGTDAEVEVQPTPLMMAVVSGCALLVAHFLKVGADPCRTCVMGLPGKQRGVTLTPLIAAVTSGHPGIAERLLEAGADVHQQCGGAGGGADMSSALSSAVLAGSCEMVRLLVEHGACGGRNGGARVGHNHPGLKAAALAAQLGRADMLDVIYPPLAGALQGGSAAMLGRLKRRTILHPLTAAAQGGHLAAVQRLLELGASPSHSSSVMAGVQQYTPLMLAAANGHLAVMECLLSAGADPLQLNAQQHSAAALALQNGQLAAVRLLLRQAGELEGGSKASVAEALASKNAVAGGAFAEQSKAGAPVPPTATAAGLASPAAPMRPLTLRLSSSACKAWQIGFASRALPRHRPLTLAALEQERQRYLSLLAALLEADAAKQASGSASPAAAQVRGLADPVALALAAAGSDALLDVLLACGVSLACVDPADGSFPLLAAAHHGWVPLLRLLLRGADVNQADCQGCTVLMLLASRPGMLSTAQQLFAWNAALPAGAQRLDLRRLDLTGRDALGVAVATRNKPFAEELLLYMMVQQQQQQQQAQHHGGKTTGEAVAAGAAQQAAVPPAQDDALFGVTAAGRLAFSEAVSGAYDVLLELGASCVADLNRPSNGRYLLHTQVISGTRKALAQCLKLPGIDVNVKDAEGHTACMLAVARQQPPFLREVLQGGGARLDLNARDSKGRTASLMAAAAVNTDVFQLLLEASADFSLADHEGTTPLMALAARGKHKLLSRLLQVTQPPPINAQDGRGWTALHHAAAAGRINACKVLRSLGADAGLRTTVTDGQAACCLAVDLARQAGHTACLQLLRPQLELARSSVEDEDME